MKNQEFDYIKESFKVHNLLKTNLNLGIIEKQNLRKKSKISLNEIIEYLEYGVSKLKNENWKIHKLAVYDEEMKKIYLTYYAVDSGFEDDVKSFVKLGTEREKTNKRMMDFFEKNDFLFKINKKPISISIKNRNEIFRKIAEVEERKCNYLEENFFEFPDELDGLYDIIVDHVNRKNNTGYVYTKKA